MRWFLLIFLLGSISIASPLLDKISEIDTHLQKDLQIQSLKSELIWLQNWNPNQFTSADYTHNSAKALDKLFQIKTRLRAEFAALKNPEEIKVRTYRKVQNSLRYIEDQVAENFVLSKLPEKPQFNTFENTTGFNQNEKGSTYSIEELKSGDILLIRGSSVTSSSIARIAKTPSVHSHLAIVYRDPITNEGYLLEAMSHSGVIKSSLQKALNRPLARVSVYRTQDQKLATEAAHIANESYSQAAAKGKILKFDFTMDMTYNCRFFCSKFVSWVYSNGSHGQTVIPLYPSNIVRTNNSFKNNLGVKPETHMSFLPSDIDTDPRFELVNEYRNPEMTYQARIDDLITDKIFEWIEKENLDFKPSFLIKFFSEFMMKAIQIKPLHSFLQKIGIDLNPETPTELISTMAIMKYIVDNIKKEILVEFSNNYNLLGRNMTNQEIYTLIETYRKNNPKILKYLTSKGNSKALSCRKSYL